MSDLKESNQFNYSKKRLRNPSEWKREKRKRLRVAGKEYVNSKGHVVDARRMGEDCKCRRKCYLNISEDNRRQVFHGYYSLRSHDEQNAYLFGLIRRQGIARKRSKDSERRSCTYKYFLRLKGREIQVCRLAFANIHGISPHKIRILCQKLDQNVMFPRDGRGKHDNRPKRISSNVVNNIKEHIYSIVKSDKVREFLKDMKNTGADLNITKMWKDYIKKIDPNFKGYSNPAGKPVQAQCEHLNFFSAQEKRCGSSELSAVSLSKSQEIINNLYSIEHSSEPSISVAHSTRLPNNSTTLVYDQQTHGLSKVGESSSCCNFQDSDKLKDLDGIIKNQHSGGNYSPFLRSNEMSDDELTSVSSKPLVKQWLYSKVFHDEFSFQDYSSLKSRLMEKINNAPDSAIKGQQKAERKQRLPKKLSRDKARQTNRAIIQSPSELNNAYDVQQNHEGPQTDGYSVPFCVQNIPLSLNQVGPGAMNVNEITGHMGLNFHIALNQVPGTMDPSLYTPISELPSVNSNEEIERYEPATTCSAAGTHSNASCEYLNIGSDFYA